ncbi:MAG: hypothetical protein IJ630_01495 [Treponema sp.]|nr:hypothetical protein [Treponema sp.]
MFLFPRTKKQIIEVFRYCCFRGLKAECEGILVLEEDRENPPLDENGTPLFNRKINQFLRESQSFILDGCGEHLPEMNKNLIRNLHPSHSSKIIMTVAGITLEEMLIGIKSDWEYKALEKIAAYLNADKTLFMQLDGIAKEYEKQRPISADENHLVPE